MGGTETKVYCIDVQYGTVYFLTCPSEIMCDMIKRNESDVGDVVLGILAKTVFHIVANIAKSFITLQPDIQL